ncbi:FAD-dependent monooxygenase [Dactylosporangium vinaceum]|uniref:FAD-dependent monooxygenase n=1 Tax=Dactylosporangium vinaceum TaxID=53362 RepID=A0ABV5M9Z2_9ACTN|nr:FAD-dependent monooxygenase [Dactylosporangium vinaceum]UAB93147.1 FAD-dependent monooxygenase [Dactylosporangium vinaceum]
MAGAEPVLVVGAGPTGLALACELYRHGVPCRVVEARAQRGTRSKAIAIWPRVLEIMAGFGAVDAALERGIRLHGAAVWSRGRPTLTFGLGALSSRYNFGLVLPQFETEDVLERRLAALGGSVEHGVQCVGVTPTPVGADVRLEHAGGRVEQVRAAWIVGCDGSASAVRTAAGIGMRQKLEPEGWIAADVRLRTPLEPTAVNYFLTRGQVLHVVPLRRHADGLTWRLTLNVGPVRPVPAQWPPERIAAVARERAAVDVEVLDVEWTSAFRVRQGLAERFVAGRVLVAGDAAHVHSPAGAQGINAGLQDAANLGWKLALVSRGAAPPGLLDTYDAERRPAARAVVAATDRVTRMGTLRPRPAVAVRDWLWRTAVRRGLTDALLAPAMAGFTQRHHRSAASPGRRALRPGAPAAGARLPDADLGDGRRLWDRLPERGFCVLLAGGASLAGPPPGVPVVAVTEPPAVAALRAEGGAVFVVRPDRYIAMRCRPGAAAAAVAAYFDAIEEDAACPVRET